MTTLFKLLVGISLIALAIGGFLRYGNTTQDILGGGTGTIQQLEQWKNSGGYITQNVSGTLLKLTGYESSGYCLTTNASGIVGTTTCGTGTGGGSNWLYNGSRLTPSTTVGIGVFALRLSLTSQVPMLRRQICL